MNKLSLIFVFVALATVSVKDLWCWKQMCSDFQYSNYFNFLVFVSQICSGRYLPKKEHVKQTSQEWTEVAKKIGWDDEQTAAVVDLMHFIQEHDIESGEMDTNTEWRQSMVKDILQPNLERED